MNTNECINTYCFTIKNTTNGEIREQNGYGINKMSAYNNLLENLSPEYSVIEEDDVFTVSKYRLVDYFDVCGNEEGWEVNNLSRSEDEYIIYDDYTSEDIINMLVNMEFLKDLDNIHELITIEDSGDGFIEFYETETMKPLGRLDIVR